MKHLSTLSTLIFGLIFTLSAQQSSQTFAKIWESPKFDRAFVLRNQIKSVQVKSFGAADLSNIISGATYEFDNTGNLVQMVELQQKDTSRIHQFAYTKTGILSKNTTDKVWNKHYKSWYRFNRNKTLFQVKSYEMLRNNEAMLLDTRQYVYDQDSLLIAIRYLENNHVVRIHEYDYDEKNRVKEERFLNRNGDQIRKINYQYNNRNLQERVLIEENTAREYVYSYTPSGQPAEIKWLEDGDLVGTVTYTYTNGLLTRMDRRMEAKADKKATALVRMFEYEKFN